MRAYCGRVLIREEMNMKKRTVTAAIVSVILVAAACMAFAACGSDAPRTYNVNSSSATLPTYSTYTEMIANIRPSVVEVYGEGYGESNGQTVLMTSAGAGVIIGEDGEDGYYIVTNQHVVEDCYYMYVNVLSIAEDGTESTTTYTAEFIGGSHERDIAVLRIDSDEDLTVANWLENIDDLMVGSEVIAIGNPTGTLGGTVTRGIVSATSRKIDVEDIGSMDLIQMDAAINSGNSGGGLFYTYETESGDWSAALAGIVNSGASGYDGLGFAIPADDAKYAVDNLIDTYNTDDELYGYVPGDASLTITASSGTVYTDDLSGRETIVYAQYAPSDDLSGLDTYEEYLSGAASTFDAIRQIAITDADTGDTTTTTVTSAQDVYDAFDNVSAGDTLVITVEAIESQRMSAGSWFGRPTYTNVLALSGETETITVDSLSQYRYSPPDAPSATA